MRQFFLLITAFFLVTLSVSAQTSTYILLRHAEKDTSKAGAAMMTADPPLSEAGRIRAGQLPDILKAYKPDEIYSTNYTRTRSTVAPLARKFGKEIEIYDPAKLQAFAGRLLSEKGKTIIVAGHSNTTPALANLLIGQKKYNSLDESVYNRFWVIQVRDGKLVSEEMIAY